MLIPGSAPPEEVAIDAVDRALQNSSIANGSHHRCRSVAVTARSYTSAASSTFILVLPTFLARSAFVCAATNSTCLHVVAKRLFSPGLVAHPQCASNAAGQQRVSTRHRRSTAWWVHTKTGFRNNMHRRSAAWCVHTTTGFRTNITALKIALLQSWLTRTTKYSSPLHGIQQHSCK